MSQARTNDAIQDDQPLIEQNLHPNDQTNVEDNNGLFYDIDLDLFDLNNEHKLVPSIDKIADSVSGPDDAIENNTLRTDDVEWNQEVEKLFPVFADDSTPHFFDLSPELIPTNPIENLQISDPITNISNPLLDENNSDTHGPIDGPPTKKQKQIPNESDDVFNTAFEGPTHSDPQFEIEAKTQEMIEHYEGIIQNLIKHYEGSIQSLIYTHYLTESRLRNEYAQSQTALLLAKDEQSKLTTLLIDAQNNIRALEEANKKLKAQSLHPLLLQPAPTLQKPLLTMDNGPVIPKPLTPLLRNTNTTTPLTPPNKSAQPNYSQRVFGLYGQNQNGQLSAVKNPTPTSTLIPKSPNNKRNPL